ncbi:exosortase family protein XrtF [Wenyingzhuangia sp. chi5]|uniref:Exosortase family protein XrtF n=1 Tax=Wenyingzhuangia gilva TaxID=3057677 RepID=A0ABT8VNG6_9FLAO|nr:exosortase family protein XrtF [Wenyingzhuangia sp. chi5]MDO3693521.1 exosortase family protein XrtF [Wenyingzhuangia sp. chi5]
MKNKKIWWFLLRFFGTYFLLFLGYSFFLLSTQSKAPNFKSDPITQHVAKSTEWMLNIWGAKAHVEQHSTELSLKLFMEDNYVARVIEGCNSMSIIILFVAFVVAFRGAWKKTFLFAFVGGITIYFVNIFRIALLSYGMVYFKQYEMILHDLLFPAFIYGYVFLLWVIWVNRFSNLKKK